MIRVLGSSSVLCKGLPEKECYVSMLQCRFQEEYFSIDGTERGTTDRLIDDCKFQSTQNIRIFNILHFRADEWLKFEESRQLNNMEREVLNYYQKTTKNSNYQVVFRRLFHSLCKIILIRCQILRTQVSRTKQLNNYRTFLEKSKDSESFTLIILDTGFRHLSPFFENMERISRSKILKDFLNRFLKCDYLDYSDLGIGRKHFQNDKLHLNRDGNILLFDAISKCISREFSSQTS